MIYKTGNLCVHDKLLDYWQMWIDPGLYWLSEGLMMVDNGSMIGRTNSNESIGNGGHDFAEMEYKWLEGTTVNCL